MRIVFEPVLEDLKISLKAIKIKIKHLWECNVHAADYTPGNPKSVLFDPFFLLTLHAYKRETSKL